MKKFFCICFTLILLLNSVCYSEKLTEYDIIEYNDISKVLNYSMDEFFESKKFKYFNEIIEGADPNPNGIFDDEFTQAYVDNNHAIKAGKTLSCMCLHHPLKLIETKYIYTIDNTPMIEYVINPTTLINEYNIYISDKYKLNSYDYKITRKIDDILITNVERLWPNWAGFDPVFPWNNVPSFAIYYCDKCKENREIIFMSYDSFDKLLKTDIYLMYMLLPKYKWYLYE